MATDGGTIYIRPKLDIEELEKNIDYAEKELKKLSNEADKLTNKKADIEAKITINDNELTNKLHSLDKKMNIELGANTIDGRINPDVEKKITDKYSIKASELQDKYTQKANESYDKLEKINQAIQDNAKSQEAFNQQIDETSKKLDIAYEKEEQASSFKDLKDTISDKAFNIGSSLSSLTQRFDFGGISKKIDGIGKSVQGITKKVLKWGLAIFGIRSAYNLVRQAVSTISQQNEQVKNQIAIIKGALASALEPIVTRVVNLIYTLFSYINGIIKSITGKDLFASAKKNLEKGAKSSKEINKQLSSFDEANVLSDSSSGTSSSGLDLPNVDSKLIDFLDKLKEMIASGDFAGLGTLFSEKIISALNKIADFIQNIDFTALGTKLSDFLTHIDFSGLLKGLIRVFGEAVLGLQDFILAIDWGTILKNVSNGIADAIQTLGSYIRKIDFKGIAEKLSEAITSINWGGIGTEILNLLFDAGKGILDFLGNINWAEIGKTLSDTFMEVSNTLIGLFENVDWYTLGMDIANNIIDFLSNIDWANVGLNIILGIADGLWASIQLVTGFFTNLITAILELFGIHSPSTLFFDMAVDMINGLVNGLKSIMQNVINVFTTIWTKIKNVFSGVATWFKERFTEAWNKIKAVFNGVGTFFGGIWDTIKGKFKDLGTKIGDTVGGAFKNVINAVIGAIEKILNTPIKAINKLIGVIKKIPGLDGLQTLDTFSFPRLAKGGIINQPGRGVMIGSAIAGERGAEGVIPLTDSQQMALLGEAIGKYITINANITNTMNGRVISRELQRINNENDFAYNR